MKNYLLLLFLLPILVLGQKKPDYFIQFNSAQLKQKVSFDSIANYPFIKSLTGSKSEIKINDFLSILDQTKPITIHGSLDSIAYFQITIPVANPKQLENIIQGRINKLNEKSTDSIKYSLKRFPNYSVFSSDNDDSTMAWNNDYFIIYQQLELETPKSTPSNSFDESSVSPEDTNLDTVTTDAESNENHDGSDDKNNVEQQPKIKRDLAQEEQIALLFKDGFVMPSSEKINLQATISSWLNFKSFYKKWNSYTLLSLVLKNNIIPQNPTNFIEGLTFDFYFDNDKSRINQTIEYSEPLAKIMEKVIFRKPNKNIFNFFPKETPLAYLSYHWNSEETLKNYPQIFEQALSSLPFVKEDADIVTDLISTILDEKATATLLDGDVSFFLHNLETYESTSTSITYDENYEEVATENTVTNTRPIYSIIVTSTHPTIGNKLLDLGVRKKILVKENNHYLIKGSEKTGKLYVFKDGDVVVFSNGLDYLNANTSSDFSEKLKKDLAKNYLSADFNFKKFGSNVSKISDLGRYADRLLKTCNQLSNIHCSSLKKMRKNTILIESELTSNYSNKNIILQTLDLIYK